VSFHHPGHLYWLLACLALTIFVYRREQTRTNAIHRLMDTPMLAQLGREGRAGRRLSLVGLRCLALALWVVAWAGPEWGSEQIQVERQALNIAFLVDCSRSMTAQDPPPSRTAVAHRELSLLMEKLQGNKMSLIGFAGDAYVYCPLTSDVSSAEMFLDQLDENAIPVPGTAIGRAITVAMDTLPKGSSSDVMVLLTDGEDHHSNPIEAARDAAAAGMTIYTVGIGSLAGAPMPIAEGDTSHFISDVHGKPIISKMDETEMREVAKVTGGIFERISKPTDSLEPIYQSILGREREKLAAEMTLHRKPQFTWFVIAGLCLLLISQAMTTRYSNELDVVAPSTKSKFARGGSRR
jgi:Ca-activated chloride channel family protein